MFSGAVRAVFRKKKGFGFVKILHWLLLVLFSAAAALARLRLLAVGFDADGLPVPMDLNTMVLPAVLVVAAVIAVIMARRYPAQRELCGSMDLYFAFDRSTLAVLLMVLGSFALIGSAVCSLVFSLRTTLTMILSVFLAVGAVCLLYATTALRRKAEFPGVALLVPVCAMVLALILFYREHATDPILRHYYVETLALAALTVLLLLWVAALIFGRSLAVQAAGETLNFPVLLYDVLLGVTAATAIYLFPVLSRFEMRLPQMVKLSFVMCLRYLPYTLLIAAGTALVGWLLFYKLPMACTLVLPGAWCLAITFLMEKALHHYMPKPEEGEEQWYDET